MRLGSLTLFPISLMILATSCERIPETEIPVAAFVGYGDNDPGRWFADGPGMIGDIGYWRQGKFHLDSELDPDNLNFDNLFWINISVSQIDIALEWLTEQSTVRCMDDVISFEFLQAELVFFLFENEDSDAYIEVYLPHEGLRVLFRPDQDLYACSTLRPYDPLEEEEVVITR